MPSTDSPVPTFLHGLVDDAAASRGGPIDEAVRDHVEHRAAPYADLVGPLVVADADLPLLTARVAASPLPGPLEVAVVVTGGAGALEPAVHWATDEHLALRALQVALRESDAGDPAPNARRIVRALDGLLERGLLEDDVAVYVEPPRLHDPTPSASWLTALDEVAAMDHRLSLRTDGRDDDHPPSVRELATCIAAALDRELAFTCTGGPRHALRHGEHGTGIDHHGYLNVLLATRASLDGAGADEVAAVLDERDAAAVTGALHPAAMTSARRWFRSFGSPSVLDPVRELTALGVMATT